MDADQQRGPRRADASRNDRAVLEAARFVFAVHGPDAPVSAIAERASVGIGSLYRRYSSKADLIQTLCRASLTEQAELARAAAAEATPWAALCRFVYESAHIRAGALALMAGTFEPDAETINSARLVHRRASGLLRAAQRSGDVRPDLAATDLFDLLALLSRRTGDDPTTEARTLAVLLSGLRPSADALPGRAASWAAYAQRWVPPRK